MYLRWLKPLFDFSIALLLLFVLAPVFFFLIILLSFHFKSAPFFRQLRIGKNEKPFTIIKFKTMRDAIDKRGNLLSDIARTSKLGFWLRRYGVDELPQLFNILKGEMSLVGPRPLPVHYLPSFDLTIRQRHLARPGITGLAQINGGNGLPWKQRFIYDLHYVYNISFALDSRLLFGTFCYLLRPKIGTDIGPFGGH